MNVFDAVIIFSGTANFTCNFAQINPPPAKSELVIRFY